MISASDTDAAETLQRFAVRGDGMNVILCHSVVVRKTPADGFRPVVMKRSSILLWDSTRSTHRTLRVGDLSLLSTPSPASSSTPEPAIARDRSQWRGRYSNFTTQSPADGMATALK